jgi:hypothetical protein
MSKYSLQLTEDRFPPGTRMQEAAGFPHGRN